MTTRGVLHPEAIGTMFSLERCRPPADLARFVDVHWLVSWDLRGREPYRSQVLPHPCAHHVSERTLQRLFSAYVGIGPKWVLQRYRLHEAVEQVQGQGTVDWARLALELGYYDQAHFVRDFRSLVGRTPAQYDAERTPPGPDRTRSAAGA